MLTIAAQRQGQPPVRFPSNIKKDDQPQYVPHIRKVLQHVMEDAKDGGTTLRGFCMPKVCRTDAPMPPLNASVGVAWPIHTRNPSTASVRPRGPGTGTPNALQGIAPLVGLFVQGLLVGSADSREQATLGVGTRRPPR